MWEGRERGGGGEGGERQGRAWRCSGEGVVVVEARERRSLQRCDVVGEWCRRVGDACEMLSVHHCCS